MVTPELNPKEQVKGDSMEEMMFELHAFQTKVTDVRCWAMFGLQKSEAENCSRQFSYHFAL